MDLCNLLLYYSGGKNVIGITNSLDGISTTFPDDDSIAIFEDGWLMQSEGENYRLVEKDSRFSVF